MTLNFPEGMATKSTKTAKVGICCQTHCGLHDPGESPGGTIPSPLPLRSPAIRQAQAVLSRFGKLKSPSQSRGEVERARSLRFKCIFLEMIVLTLYWILRSAQNDGTTKSIRVHPCYPWSKKRSPL